MGQQYMKSFGRKVTRFILCPFTAFSCQQPATALIYSPHRLKQIVIDLGEKKKSVTEYGSRKKTGSNGRHSFLNLLATSKKNLSDFSTLLKVLLFFCGLQNALRNKDQFLPSIYYQQGTIHH